MADEQTTSMVPIEAIQVLDPKVVSGLELLPRHEVSKIEAHGESFWTRTARLHIVGPKGTKFDGSYFLKTSFGKLGEEMMASEFRSMSLIYESAPRNLVPVVCAHGPYVTIPDVHFLICDFRPMTGEIPPPTVLVPEVAEMHRRSMSTADSRKYMFGSDFPTFHGNVRVDHGWSDSWEEYFTRTTRKLFETEQKTWGPNEEIEQMMAPFFDKVIPRLLRPLETGGRSIQPCVIHGDMWHGNTGMDERYDRPIIFDAGSFYAHNEYELGVWRQPWNKLNETYRTEYRKHLRPSQPEEDWDDRNALYAVRVNILDSILYKDDPSYRQMLISGMRELIDKFPGGFEEWEASHREP